MKRMIQWMMAAILICGATLFTACSNQDHPATPDLNLSEKIIGKWMYSETNGEPVPTNKKSVYTFVSPTKAFVSVSNTAHQEVGKFWSDQIEADVAISGNVATLTMHTTEFQTGVVEYTVSDINGRELNANRKATVYKDGQVVLSEEQIILYEKITADYRETVLGLWECEGLIGDETYNDGNDRLEFLSDGTYRFYHKDDAGQWQAVTTREFQNYFVDGTLLATRWKEQGGVELREWWEIKSLKGDKMQWKALRQNEDGSTFEQTMDWKRVVE